MKNSNKIYPLKIYFYVLIGFIIPNTLQSQDFNDYQNIKSKGKITKDFLTLSSAKYATDRTRIDKEESGFTKNTKKQFFLESNFMINELLHSGKVLYNDPLGNYVNKVLNELLKTRKELRERIRVYVVLSPIVNAYATDNGTIFINIGLLAKLKTEAQLAFVLAHELTHYEKSHVLNRYVQNETLVKGKINYSNSDIESILFSKTSYAKKQEIEADLNAITLLKSSPYKLAAGIEVMKILDTAYPFEAVRDDYTTLFHPETTVKYNYHTIIMDSLHEKKEPEEDNQTHPAIEKRITEIQNQIPKELDIKKDFEMPEKDFVTMKKSAQYELCKLFLIKGKTTSALYATYQLLQQNPDSKYLKELLCKAYYQSAKFAKDIEKHVSSIEMHYESKEIQYIHAHMSDMDAANLNALALISYLKFYPKTSKITDEIRFKDLLEDYKNNFDEDTSAYVKGVQNYLKQYPEIQSLLTKIPKKEIQKDDDNVKKMKNEVVDNIIVIDTKYKKYDLRKKKQAKYIASEKSLLQYHDQILTTAELLKIDASLLSPFQMSENDTLKFQELSTLKIYTEEVLTNGNDVIATDYEKTNRICAKYKTAHLALIGTYTFHLKKPLAAKIAILISTGIVFPTLPLGIYYAAVPTFRTYNYVIVLNTKDQSIAFKDIAEMKFKDSKGAINTSLYYQFLKMKSKKL